MAGLAQPGTTGDRYSTQYDDQGRPYYTGTVGGQPYNSYTKPGSTAAAGDASLRASTAMDGATASSAGPLAASSVRRAGYDADRSAPGYASPLDLASIDASRASTSLASQHETFAEEMARQKASMITGLMGSLKVPTIQPLGVGGGEIGAQGMPNVTGTGYDQGAENAAYGAAKDRTGNELQGALKGLEGVMAARGISGSGIEAANMRGLFENAQGEMGSTDRQLAEQRAARAFASEGANADRSEHAREFNLNFQNDQAARIQAAQLAQLQAMLQAAGMY